MTTTTSQAAEPLTLEEEVRLRQTLPPPDVRRAIRIKARVSLRRFGQEIGVSHGSVRYYEHGGEPGIDIAVRYCRELEKLAAIVGFDLAACVQK